MGGHVLLLLPAVSGLLYVVAALFFKRAISAGAGANQINFFANAVAAILYQPLWLLAGGCDWTLIWKPALAALLFLCGQIFTFVALRHGDVSVATPLLGLKVLLTAVFGSLVFGEALAFRWWIGAAASSLGIILVTGATLGSLLPWLLRADALASIAAAAFFAMTDILVQEWAPGFGIAAFIALMFGMVGAMSLAIFVPREGAAIFRTSGVGGFALYAGSAVLGIQALGMAVALGLYGNATAVNIVYSSRSIWSVVLAWLMGRVFDIHERESGRVVMLRRLAGSILLFAAVVFVLL